MGLTFVRNPKISCGKGCAVCVRSFPRDPKNAEYLYRESECMYKLMAMRSMEMEALSMIHLADEIVD